MKFREMWAINLELQPSLGFKELDYAMKSFEGFMELKKFAIIVEAERPVVEQLMVQLMKVIED